MKSNNFLWTLFLLPLLVACEKKGEGPAAASLYGFWRYQSGVEVEMQGVEPGVVPLAYVILNEDGTMSGFTSRNILGGTFRAETPDIIKLDFHALTRVYDTPWSARFQEMLNAVDRYRLEDDRLTLINREANEELAFLRMSPNICRPIPNNAQLYEQATSDPFTFKDVVVAGSCLEITVEYGGGCGDVDAMLIGAGNYMKSLPPQLNVKFILDDDDPCEALLRKTFYFNLDTVLPAGEESVILHLQDWSLAIHYNRG